MFNQQDLRAMWVASCDPSGKLYLENPTHHA